MNFATKFGIGLMVIAGGGLLIDSQRAGSSFSNALATSPHTPLVFLGAALFLVNRGKG